MTSLQFAPPAEKYLKKLKEKPLKNAFQTAIDAIFIQIIKND